MIVGVLPFRKGLTPRMWFAEVVTPQSTEEIAVHSDIVTVTNNNQLYVSSIEVAKKFGKRHADVLRIIHEYINNKNMSNFNQRNFALASDTQLGRGKRGRPRLAEVLMSRDGFSLIAMGFSGKTALEWKLRFLDVFNEIEKTILTVLPELQAQLERLKIENAQLREKPKALPGKRANQIAVPVMEENLFGQIEAIRWELRKKETLDQVMQAKAQARHLRKMMKGLAAKYDVLSERLDLLEGNKKAKIIKLLTDKKDTE